MGYVLYTDATNIPEWNTEWHILLSQSVLPKRWCYNQAKTLSRTCAVMLASAPPPPSWSQLSMLPQAEVNHCLAGLQTRHGENWWFWKELRSCTETEGCGLCDTRWKIVWIDFELVKNKCLKQMFLLFLKWEKLCLFFLMLHPTKSESQDSTTCVCFECVSN